jgi:predicted DNA-binding protein with PD1-like motif
LLGPLEIVSCVGNVSLKEDAPFVHAHITLSDKEGRTYGGHLMPGTTVGATFEVTLHAYDEMKLVRKLDPTTKLFMLDA